MNGAIPILMLLLIVVIIVTIVWVFHTRKKLRKNHEQNLEQLNSIGFHIDKQVIASSGATIMLDYGSKRGALEYYVLSSYGECSDLTVFDLNKVVGCALVQDGTVVHQNAIAPSMIGAALFGLGGAIAGATAMANEEQMGVLAVRLILDDNQHSSIMIRILKTSISKASQQYQNAFYSAQEIYGVFESIVHSNEEERMKSVREAEVAASARADTMNSNVIEQVRELAKLRDDGIISNEEFEAKKIKLMDMI